MDSLELHQILRLLASLVFVLALMGGLAVVMRRINERRAGPSGKKRLRIVESLPLDARRRLVLLRRDDAEHLVILGTNGETVIESRIESGQDKSGKDLV